VFGKDVEIGLSGSSGRLARVGEFRVTAPDVIGVNHVGGFFVRGFYLLNKINRRLDSFCRAYVGDKFGAAFGEGCAKMLCGGGVTVHIKLTTFDIIYGIIIPNNYRRVIMGKGWIKVLRVASWILFCGLEILTIVLVVWNVAGNSGGIFIGVVYIIVIGVSALVLHSFMMVFAGLAEKYLTEQKIPS
jgi:hypothetical protein